MVLHTMRESTMPESFDSRADILQHILEVRAYLDTFVTEMLRRGQVHDASKFDPAGEASLR